MLRIALLACVFALTVSITAPSRADSQKGWAAYQRGDYKTAHQELLKAAEQGDANAQTWLGLMYYKGQGVQKDDAVSVIWWQEAAEQGNKWAQFNLGLMYANGEGVLKDNAVAARWYRKSAEQGHARA